MVGAGWLARDGWCGTDGAGCLARDGWFGTDVAGQLAQDLATKLMETTHGQWMYHNVQVHDATQGEERTKREEELRNAITRQIDLDVEDLEEDDQYLMELVLKMDSLEESSGESQQHWLLAIVAAREACELRRRERGGREDSAGGQTARRGHVP